MVQDTANATMNLRAEVSSMRNSAEQMRGWADISGARHSGRRWLFPKEQCPARLSPARQGASDPREGPSPTETTQDPSH